MTCILRVQPRLQTAPAGLARQAPWRREDRDRRSRRLGAHRRVPAAPEHEIVVYEAGTYAGGHTNTVRVDTPYGSHHIDTGFIVMNDRNYPTFTRLLDRLGVARQPTHMSFSVKSEEDDFEYSGTPRGIFCQPRNLLSARFPAHAARHAALQPPAAPRCSTNRSSSATQRNRSASSSLATASRAASSSA